MDGERRPLRVPLTEVVTASDGDALLLAFRLPKGSFATAVLHEVMKDSAATTALLDVAD
jgi:tRNA pseudouridine13 synthase